ncbi:hypothetical protein [Fusarium sibiricum coguvirus 1]|nr:hypothetical protein [Fusarium sibiricum coguvirus 1]
MVASMCCHDIIELIIKNHLRSILRLTEDLGLVSCVCCNKTKEKFFELLWRCLWNACCSCLMPQIGWETLRSKWANEHLSKLWLLDQHLHDHPRNCSCNSSNGQILGSFALCTSSVQIINFLQLLVQDLTLIRCLSKVLLCDRAFDDGNCYHVNHVLLNLLGILTSFPAFDENLSEDDVRIKPNVLECIQNIIRNEGCQVKLFKLLPEIINRLLCDDRISSLGRSFNNVKTSCSASNVNSFLLAIFDLLVLNTLLETAELIRIQNCRCISQNILLFTHVTKECIKEIISGSHLADLFFCLKVFFDFETVELYE